MNPVSPFITPGLDVSRAELVTWGWILILGGLLISIFVGRPYARYLGLPIRSAVLLALGASLLGLCLTFWLLTQRPPTPGMAPAERVLLFTRCLAGGFTVLFAVPLVAKLYLAWVMDRMTDAERLAGGPGVRAWLRPLSLTAAIGTAAGASWGLDQSFFLILGAALAALVAAPITRTVLENTAPTGAAASSATTGTPAPEVGEERGRVLRLLEEGRITADDAQELLNVLPHGNDRPAKPPLGAAGKALLAGAALVLVGFVLPWFRVDVGAELAARTQQALAGFVGLDAMPAAQGGGADELVQMVQYIHAGDLANGLGWLILAAVVAAAALAIVNGDLARRTGHVLPLLVLGVGAVLLAHVTASAIRFAHAGLVVAWIGYALALLGGFALWRTAQPVD